MDGERLRGGGGEAAETPPVCSPRARAGGRGLGGATDSGPQRHLAAKETNNRWKHS